jgi:hypothetical protein
MGTEEQLVAADLGTQRRNGMMKPGDVRPFKRGKHRALALAIGVWAERIGKDGPIHVHLTGTPRFHTTVTNQRKSERYHRTLFRNMRSLLMEYDRWPFGNEGEETEVGS